MNVSKFIHYKGGMKLVLESIVGIIAGTVSGTGMGGGTILILVLSLFMRH